VNTKNREVYFVKKLINIIFLSILTVIIISGCSKSTTSPDNTAASQATSDPKKDPVKIVFATNETPVLNKEFWKTVSDKFMAANPGVIVENIAQPSSNVTLKDYLKTLLSTGQFPDVMVMSAPGDFVPSGALMELPDDFLTYIADPNTGRYGGKQYLVPYKKMLNGVFYNKKIFADQGISEPKTYQELLDLSEKLKSKNIVPFDIGLKDGWTQTTFASMIISADVLTGNPNWGIDRNADKVKFSSPEFVNAMKKYANLTMNYASKDIQSISYAQQIDLFFSGKAAMFPIGSWVMGEEQRVKPDFEVGFFPFPGDKDASTVSVFVNEGLSISAKTKHAEEAKAFVKFFMTDKAWYGQFLKTEMLFPTTKEDVPYEMSTLRKETADKVKDLKTVEVFDSATGDAAMLPGLATYMGKATQNISTGANVEKEMELFDKEWDKANKNLQK
jgi:raffinose/stachyose/melibiose transport system substrate-binding protein